MPSFVSIVLPAYNAASCIAAAIGSIRAQTTDTWELLVIDDGSDDDTAAAAAAAAKQDARIRIVRQAHAGIAVTLNAGATVARGELIARMDADDVAHPRRIEEQRRFLAENPTVGVAGCLVAHGGDRATSLGYALHVDWTNTLVTPEQIALNRFVESPIVHPSAMFRRDLLDRYGGYAEGNFPEDYELWLRWLDAGVPIAKVPQVLLTWNDAAGRLSRTHPRYSPDAFFQLKAKWIAAHLRRAGVLGAREIWVWGAGRPTRKRADYLQLHGVSITGYIDVDSKKIGGAVGGRPVIGLSSLPDPARAFVLGYVSSRGARELIRQALYDHGYVEGGNFLMCA